MRIETSKLNGFGVELHLSDNECDMRVDAQRQRPGTRLLVRLTPALALAMGYALHICGSAAEKGEQAVEQMNLEVAT